MDFHVHDTYYVVDWASLAITLGVLAVVFFAAWRLGRRSAKP
jgi:heme/copper-type cytochrome/quinol oxidase subunit 1